MDTAVKEIPLDFIIIDLVVYSCATLFFFMPSVLNIFICVDFIYICEG